MEPLPQHLIKRAINTELAIGALAAITELRDQLSELERAAIVAAREKGASWRDIADAMGVTRQALQQRVARYTNKGLLDQAELERARITPVTQLRPVDTA